MVRLRERLCWRLWPVWCGGEGMTPKERLKLIKSRCTEEGRCWLWTGAQDGHGRPQMRHDGKVVYVRRLVRELTDGQPVPKGFVAAASCGQKLCVSPHCSCVATHKQRAQMAAARGAFGGATRTRKMTRTKRQAPGFSPGSERTGRPGLLCGKLPSVATTVPNSSFAIRQLEPSTEISGNSPSRMGVREVGALLNESAQADAVGHGRPVEGIPVLQRGEDVKATKHAKSRITADMVQAIRLAPPPCSRIASEVGVSLSHVKAIRRGTARRDLGNPFAGLVA